jgi:HEAT repeat protein
MSRIWLLLVILTVLPVAGNAKAVYQGQQEPKPRLFQGKPLADWIEAANYPDPTVRKNAAQVFDTSIIPSLIKESTSKDYWTRRDSVEDLGRIGLAAKVALPTVMSFLKDEDPITRVIAATAVRRIDPQTNAAVPVLVAALKIKGDITVLCFAAVAFQEFGEEAVQPLLQVLPELGEYGQMFAVGSLTSIGKPAIPGLVKALEHKSPVIRLCAVQAIAGMDVSFEDVKPAIPALRRLLSDTDPYVAAEAAVVLRRWEK